MLLLLNLQIPLLSQVHKLILQLRRINMLQQSLSIMPYIFEPPSFNNTGQTALMSREVAQYTPNNIYTNQIQFIPTVSHPCAQNSSDQLKDIMTLLKTIAKKMKSSETKIKSKLSPNERLEIAIEFKSETTVK